jgi:putative acetyltransferase
MNTPFRTNSNHPGFRELVKELDAYLAVIDGDEHDFYAQYNGIESLDHVIVIYEQEKAVACGAFKELEPGIIEIKRMFVLPEQRGKKLASYVLQALEEWAKELGYQKSRLETGKRMPDAIGLYTHRGYRVVENYGQYAGVENSVCFEKEL